TPVVTGTVDWQAADAMTQAWIDAHGLEHRQPCGCTCGGCTCKPPGPMSPQTRARLSQTLLRLAADALSGPAGLAGYLRTRLPGTGYPTASLPLDVGHSDKIPDHIRRAVILRDRHCAWPGGCDKPPAGCHIHHLTPKAEGGTTRLSNLLLLCEFHHQVCIHRLGWKLLLHPDGSTEAISPWGQTLHSHGPPTTKAA
ncbi:MAG TPA: HNH endonuclease signature motif containing protein, partial [Trebonia sp.]